ncbi:MAG: hypothetical protein RML35_09725 [Chloroherpetonaceae bacterium]|nr:hypothetical protein [Chloroherpetonaceae bacterium]
MKRIHITSLICLLLANEVQAQEERYAAAFLDIPLGVRALGVGGQFTPIDNTDGSAFFWNPSALALIKGKFVSTMYSSQFGSIGNPLSNYFHIGYSQDLGAGIGASFNWIRNSVGNIPLTNEPTGARGDYFRQIRAGILDNGGATFSSNDDALFLSLGKTIINTVDFGWQYFRLPIEIPLGVTFKYVSQSFGGDRRVSFSGNGIGVNLGTLIKFKLGDLVGKQLFGDLVLALTVKDLFNTTISWNTDLRTRAAIPRSFLFHFSYKQPLEFLSSALIFLLTRDTKYEGLTSIGVEYRFKDLLALRVGSYDRNLTLGAGIFLLRALYLDYAYQSSELGAPHRVGLTVNLAEFF